ncbi:hypothetical protein [Mesorhizobium sp.]|uniref:hypothetical protein n=1 Tax=Mesorhizobium sp. TaxID=1871066 RepID=UPI000FD5B802|nr:hypothetical protein [Mesorhizobium sp.]RUU14401.1 hypothetical protein EOD10_14495 [Mesorhizobium sp. M7A.T.Ca.TU.009.01.3.2]RUU74787.1 hypothetical protein EOD00_38675 [Mesorhizobium sp. M7A.T.Ca.TU.009.01.3.1]RWO83338.1 MAG: hypothetical protein EOQ96_21910 [Mesorhizobium sp.]RWP12273.1 MAG: hypothetical protein EOQ97_07515 [Mesorhizobium sp.]RWP92217.1 MAG: hypothetical protein EOR12_06055 [Mesorhizobium sp.]
MLARAAAILSLFAWLPLVPLAHAGAQSIPASAEGQIEFNTPSGNIGCIYTPKGGTGTYEPKDGGPELSCSRVEPSYVTIILGPKGPATLIKNPGEQGCCSDVDKLGYGNSWSAGPFSCQSSTKGLTCTATNGHGFFISKAKATVK